MTRAGCTVVVASTLTGWGAVYLAAREGLLVPGLALVLGALYVLALVRMTAVTCAPAYDRVAAHSYAKMACVLGLTLIAVLWFL